MPTNRRRRRLERKLGGYHIDALSVPDVLDMRACWCPPRTGVADSNTVLKTVDDFRTSWELNREVLMTLDWPINSAGYGYQPGTRPPGWWYFEGYPKHGPRLRTCGGCERCSGHGDDEPGSDGPRALREPYGPKCWETAVEYLERHALLSQQERIALESIEAQHAARKVCK